MPERNPFEETMRAGMGTPDRNLWRTREGFGRTPVTLGEGSYMGGRPPGQGRQVEDVFDPRRIGLGEGPHTYGEQNVFDPRRLGLGEGPHTYGKDPFDPRRLGMDSGIFGGSKAGPASDTVGSILGGMGRGQEEGYESVEKTTDDRMEEKLWGKAVNNFPPGTPDMVLQQEWERLKQDYFGRKYGGQGPTLPGRGDIVGLS